MNEAPVFTIAGELSIYRAAELCQALQAWLPQVLACGNDAVYLDLAEVSDMDTAGLLLQPMLEPTYQELVAATQPLR